MEVDGRSWVVIGSLWLGTTFFVAYEIAPASLMPLIRSDLAIGPTAASWLISVFLLAMAVFSIPSGVVLDRVDNRFAMVIAAGILLASTGWAWWAGTVGDYPSLIVSRFVGGGAEVAMWTAAVNIVSAVTDEKIHGTVIAVLATSIPAGFTIGHLTAPTLAGVLNWTGVFLLYSVLGTLSIVGFWIVSRGVTVSIDVPRPTSQELIAVLQNGRVWLIGGLAFVAFSLNLLFNSWLPSYMVESFSLSLIGGGVVAAGFPAIGIIARLSGGIGSDQYFRGERTPLVLVSFLVIIPIIPLLVIIDSVIVLFGGLIIAGFAMQLGLVLLIPLVREQVDDNVAATALSVLNTVGFVGAFSSPIIAASLIEQLGFWAAFGYATLLAITGVVLVLFVPEDTFLPTLSSFSN